MSYANTEHESPKIELIVKGKVFGNCPKSRYCCYLS